MANRINVVELVQNSVAQAMGTEFVADNNDIFANKESYKLVELGKQILSATGTVESFTKSLIAQVGKIENDVRVYAGELPSIVVNSMEWGGVFERNMYQLGDIVADPMWNLVNGTSYANEEHKMYLPKIDTLIFDEDKAIMTPITLGTAQLKEAFTSWGQMESFVSGIRVAIQNTKKIGLNSMAFTLMQDAIAVSDKNTQTAVHLRTEAVAKGISGVTALSTPTALLNNPDFLIFALERIAEVQDNMEVLSTAYNDGSVPTFTSGDYKRTYLIKAFERAVKFKVDSKIYNPEKLSIGTYETVTAWQGIKDASATFDIDTITGVKISADTNNKLGIGTSAYEGNCLAVVSDKTATEIVVKDNRVTSSYTAITDTYNEFNHTLCNVILDKRFNFVAFMLD